MHYDFILLKDLNSKEVERLRFTRALFGLTSSSSLLGGVIQHLLDSCREKYPEIVREIEKCLYVDDLISGAPTSKKASYQINVNKHICRRDIRAA